MRRAGTTVYVGTGLGVMATTLFSARAQTPPDYDFQFVTVGAPGNEPYRNSAPNQTNVNGRGSVDYSFRASTLEVTTGQWMEFLNTFAPFADSTLSHHEPVHWGAGPTRAYPNNRWGYSLRGLPGDSMMPVGGITWRDAARYVNWLHNGKQADPATLITGAYDTTTFGRNPDGSITDAPTRLPGARYFIPTLDEQLKASQYDPNRYGPGQGGWWLNKNMSDEPGIPGAPGEGTTSAAYFPPSDPFSAWDIPLGSYTTSLSPWGLLDTSGGTQEWNERLSFSQRGLYGASAGGNLAQDQIHRVSAADADSGSSTVGLRIFSAVPSPSSVAVSVLGLGFVLVRRRFPWRTCET